MTQNISSNNSKLTSQKMKRFSMNMTTQPYRSKCVPSTRQKMPQRYEDHKELYGSYRCTCNLLESLTAQNKKNYLHFFQNLPDPNSLKAEKISQFKISGSAHQGVYVNSETSMIVRSSPLSLKAVSMDGTMKSFAYYIELMESLVSIKVLPKMCCMLVVRPEFHTKD